MTTVGKLRQIILDCEKDWTITLNKWEHHTKEELEKRQYKLPNIVSVQIVDSSTIYNGLGGKIHQYILQESDEEFQMTMDEMLWFFCGERNDNDLIDIVLEVEQSKGHFDHIQLTLEHGDKGYSDKNMIILLEEKE